MCKTIAKKNVAVHSVPFGESGRNKRVISLRAAAFVLPWHRPPGQVWWRGNLLAVLEIASPERANARLATTLVTW